MAVFRCTNDKCPNDSSAAKYQTEKYGERMRVMTPKKGDPKAGQQFGCTICGTYQTPQGKSAT
jgi:hypothetical protein